MLAVVFTLGARVLRNADLLGVRGVVVITCRYVTVKLAFKLCVFCCILGSQGYKVVEEIFEFCSYFLFSKSSATRSKAIQPGEIAVIKKLLSV